MWYWVKENFVSVTVIFSQVPVRGTVIYEKTYFNICWHVFRFLPALAKDTLEKMLDKNSVLRPSAASLEAAAAADIKVPFGQIGLHESGTNG